MAAHQVGDEVLLLFDALCQLIKALLEPAVRLDMGLAHEVKDVVGAVLRCDLELTADVVLDQLPEEAFVLVAQEIIIPDAGTDEHTLDLGE